MMYRQREMIAGKIAQIEKMRRYLAYSRNRFAHEYLPEELAKIYAAIVGQGGPESLRLRAKVARLD